MFTLAKLTGQFYGGAVDFNGTIDATKDALTLDLQGSLQGIYLGEMLRGTAGTNSFGNQNLMVSIDGKINVMDIALKGSGTSPEQIRNSLNGGGQVSGSIYPSVTGGSLGFASFATGVGSIFSTEMGLASATLAGFINHQSSITGQLVLQGDTVTLQNHTLQGQNAVATITSQQQHDVQPRPTPRSRSTPAGAAAADYGEGPLVTVNAGRSPRRPWERPQAAAGQRRCSPTGFRLAEDS